jgi:hypothetical protein
MPEYAIPDRVLRNAELRLNAHRHLRYCAIDGCQQLATHSPVTGHDSCETHRTTPAMPTPDPGRTMRALQLRLAADLAADLAAKEASA